MMVSNILSYLNTKKRNIHLFMKICIKYNQVEVALQALHGSVEKVVFGAASLKDKYKLQYVLKTPLLS